MAGHLGIALIENNKILYTHTLLKSVQKVVESVHARLRYIRYTVKNYRVWESRYINGKKIRRLPQEYTEEIDYIPFDMGCYRVPKDYGGQATIEAHYNPKIGRAIIYLVA